ncbi:MAG: gas vesicle protein GvpG [Rhodomicrobiaceae bacterium]
MMIGRLLSFPVTGPISLTLWLARTIAERAEAELYDEGKIRREIAELEMRSDLGEITEEDYERREESLMARLRESRKRART